jgi:predicted Zn-dependent protease
MGIIENFEALLATGQDSALLRFSLGSEYLKAGDVERAVIHLRAAVRLDPTYSAAWKALGKALSEGGACNEALEAYVQGIAVAERKGDKQAAKEMQVFRRRLEKSLASQVALNKTAARRKDDC